MEKISVPDLSHNVKGISLQEISACLNKIERHAGAYREYE